MIGYHLERGSSFEIGRPRSRGWKNFTCRYGWGVLKIGQFSWTSYVYHPQGVTNEVISLFSSVNCASRTNTVSDSDGRVMIIYKH